ncbi:hypothetical protein ABGB07_15580 [Micromonosporaceae bacterium B7E4]
MSYQSPITPDPYQAQPPPQQQPAEPPLYATDLGAPAAHPRPRRSPILAAGIATLVALIVIFGVGYVVYTQFIREDTGIAACKAIRDGGTITGEPKSENSDKLTEDEYRELRSLFEDSDKEKIREHGTALVDLAWQISQMPDGQEMGALAFIGPMGTHVAGLQTACADEGIIISLTNA